MTDHSHAAILARRLKNRSAVAGVVGLGYVGLPLAIAAARAGFTTIGFDIDLSKIARLGAGQSYIDAVASDDLAGLVVSGRFQATDNFDRLAECDVIAIAVPTPLSAQRDPDLRFVVATAESIAARLRPGQLIALESTTWPGTTDEVLKPILERGGLRSGVDFFLAFSPEREDPGNASFQTASIPKVVAGDGSAASALAEAFYSAVVERVVPVSNTKVAEAVKITENVFRAVNIALVNELKVIYDAMGIDVWEVIDAAATKPFGYMPFYPGPGLGGHCIPIDPFYLSWKSREFGITARFIELAGEINMAMPHYVLERLEQALDAHQRVSLGASKILVLGLAYKRNISDIRESPSLKLIELLVARGTDVSYHDPHVTSVPGTRDHGDLAGMRSIELSPDTLREFNAVLVVTDHDAVDYKQLAEHARLILDTRNALARRGISSGVVVKA